MGNQGGRGIDGHGHLTKGQPIRGYLPYSVHRPVGKGIPIALSMLNGSSNTGVLLDKSSGLINKTERITLNQISNHTRIRINKSRRSAGGYPAIFHLVQNGCLLSEGFLQSISEAVPIGIILRPAVQISKLIELEPVGHPIPIAVLGGGQVVGNGHGGVLHPGGHLAYRHARTGCLAHPIYRPVGKSIPIALPVQVGGGGGAVDLHKALCGIDKAQRVALHGVLHHAGIRIDKGG